eukprot:Blabericola_migrator_1__4676@NODE_2472_length_2710_cov_68_833144_g1549_i0_p3_GENE_NODE_2472_length_2710_cov_68_833144_g1549_i0NODE_2472_length_2710_cov_68_833144_g1549_i0_p3_ORF_typecomplete_len104_score17_97PDCD2_C/PF04194_13/1_6e21_NODE_2472_length_2710_cov_68_833144_g1549_i07191030
MSRLEPHIIRYGADRPIWFCAKEMLDETSVPKCTVCGSERLFEFQIHSTVMDYLGTLDNMELSFGTLCCYTCPHDCDSDEVYIEEFIFKQRDPTLDKRVWRQL